MTAIPFARIVTPRLVLRCWRQTDAALFKRAIDSSLDHLRLWLPWAGEDRFDLPSIRDRLARMSEDFHAGRDFLYGAFDPAEREVVGGTGLHPRLDAKAIEIGYWIRADLVGRGYATEAARALTLAAFDQLGVERVEIRCDPNNVASAAVPRRLGYRHTITLPNNSRTPDGRPRDTLVWEATVADRDRMLADAVGHPA